jgi:hypothetical protein
MSAKTVTIDHPHAEVIAAHFSGKAVQIRLGDDWANWDREAFGEPKFRPGEEWRIKPEPLVRWVVVDGDPYNMCYENLKDAERALGGIRHHGRDARIVRMVEQPE